MELDLWSQRKGFLRGLWHGFSKGYRSPSTGGFQSQNGLLFGREEDSQIRQVVGQNGPLLSSALIVHSCMTLSVYILFYVFLYHMILMSIECHNPWISVMIVVPHYLILFLKRSLDYFPLFCFDCLTLVQTVPVPYKQKNPGRLHIMWKNFPRPN